MTSKRTEIIQSALKMNALGINQGTSGNVSLREKTGLLITPSGMAYEDLLEDHIVFIDQDAQASGSLKPSSEWRFHYDIYQNRPDLHALVHTHSKFATTLACLRQELPPFHYMIGVCGGKNVRCAPYATFGTQALSDHVLKAMEGRKACLMANHGMIVGAETLSKALAIAEELELLCEQYLTALQCGTPYILTDAEMEEVLEKFKTYGKQDSVKDQL